MEWDPNFDGNRLLPGGAGGLAAGVGVDSPHAPIPKRSRSPAADRGADPAGVPERDPEEDPSGDPASDPENDPKGDPKADPGDDRETDPDAGPDGDLDGNLDCGEGCPTPGRSGQPKQVNPDGRRQKQSVR